jgi:nucleotide-binding universal stress UspA family protein
VADSGEAASTEGDEDRHRVLVAVARPDRAPRYVELAAMLGSLQSDHPLVQVVNVTHIPEQTPFESVEETAEGRARRIQELLAAEGVDADYTVEGHISQDVAFDIVQTAREDRADLIVIGYPEERRSVAKQVEFTSPGE